MKTTALIWFSLLYAMIPSFAEEIPAPYKTITEAEAGYTITINNNTSEKKSDYSLRTIKSKIAGFQRMKKGGSSLLIGGISLNGIGTILLITGINQMINDVKSNNSPDYYYDSGYESNDPPEGFFQVYFGSISLGFGIPLTIAGAVLTSIGSKKIDEYQGRLERFSLNVSQDRWSIGYSF